MDVTYVINKLLNIEMECVPLEIVVMIFSHLDIIRKYYLYKVINYTNISFTELFLLQNESYKSFNSYHKLNVRVLKCSDTNNMIEDYIHDCHNSCCFKEMKQQNSYFNTKKNNIALYWENMVNYNIKLECWLKHFLNFDDKIISDLDFRLRYKMKWSTVEIDTSIMIIRDTNTDNYIIDINYLKTNKKKTMILDNNYIYCNFKDRNKQCDNIYNDHHYIYYFKNYKKIYLEANTNSKHLLSYKYIIKKQSYTSENIIYFVMSETKIKYVIVLNLVGYLCDNIMLINIQQKNSNANCIIILKNKECYNLLDLINHVNDDIEMIRVCNHIFINTKFREINMSLRKNTIEYNTKSSCIINTIRKCNNNSDHNIHILLHTNVTLLIQKFFKSPFFCPSNNKNIYCFNPKKKSKESYIESYINEYKYLSYSDLRHNIEKYLDISIYIYDSHTNDIKNPVSFYYDNYFFWYKKSEKFEVDMYTLNEECRVKLYKEYNKINKINKIKICKKINNHITYLHDQTNKQKYQCHKNKVNNKNYNKNLNVKNRFKKGYR